MNVQEKVRAGASLISIIAAVLFFITLLIYHRNIFAYTMTIQLICITTLLILLITRKSTKP